MPVHTAAMTPCIRRATPALLTLLAATTFAVAGCTATGSGSSSAPSAPSAAGVPAANEGLFEHPEDVTVGACVRDEVTGWAKASLTIKNQSGKASTYAVTVSVQSADGATQFGEAIAAVSSLAPGQSTTQEALGTSEIPAGVQFQCVVTSAKRTEAF